MVTPLENLHRKHILSTREQSLAPQNMNARHMRNPSLFFLCTCMGRYHAKAFLPIPLMGLLVAPQNQCRLWEHISCKQTPLMVLSTVQWKPLQNLTFPAAFVIHFINYSHSFQQWYDTSIKAQNVDSTPTQCSQSEAHCSVHTVTCRCLLKLSRKTTIECFLRSSSLHAYS